MLMNKNQNVVEGNNEVVEVKEPGKIRQFIDKHEITPKKALKTLAVAGAGAGLFILGRVTGKSNDDQSDETDYYDVTDTEDSEI